MPQLVVDKHTLEDALALVMSADKTAVYASADKLFKGAHFGRDSLEFLEDLLPTHPEIVALGLKSLAAKQGRYYNAVTEEQPGRIHHESRISTFNGQPLDQTSQVIFNRLTSLWGGDQQAFTYYGSVDATPLYVRLLLRYCKQFGNQLLDEVVSRSDGTTVSMYASLQSALKWITHSINSSPNGLLGYCSTNKHGIENQVWKDSAEFYTHKNGKRANHSRPIASIEVQGLAYDALLLASHHLHNDNYRIIARGIQQKVFKTLWLPKQQYFALGTDFDEAGHERLITTKTANPAALLDTMIFDDIPKNIRHTYIHGIINTIMSQDFLTDGGIRSRALSDAQIVSFWDYHGSYVSWPKETYDIAKGLRRQGFLMLSEQLENRILNIVRSGLSYPEFVYVDKDGHVLNQIVKNNDSKHHEVVIKSTNEPERLQAWTISAYVAINLRRQIDPHRYFEKAVWQDSTRLPLINELTTRKDLNDRYPKKAYRVRNHISGLPSNIVGF